MLINGFVLINDSYRQRSYCKGSKKQATLLIRPVVTKEI